MTGKRFVWMVGDHGPEHNDIISVHKTRQGALRAFQSHRESLLARARRMLELYKEDSRSSRSCRMYEGIIRNPFLADVSARESKERRERIEIRDGKGRYPKCLAALPYGWCPKKEEVPGDPKDVHKSCKNCDEFKKSKFYSENFAEQDRLEKIKRLKEAGLPTRLEF